MGQSGGFNLNLNFKVRMNTTCLKSLEFPPGSRASKHAAGEQAD